MAKTSTDLDRSVMGNAFRKIELCVYPGDGVLDPRWETTSYLHKASGKWKTSPADVDVVPGTDGPEVKTGGGTSLHDVSGWFPSKEFWIPEGTEYSTEILIKKDPGKKTSPVNSQLSGYHYQLEPRTQMTVLAFKGYLNNMARAAVVRQCELANSKQTS